MIGSEESEHPRLTNIISEQIPTYVITIHQRHRRTDRQTTCDRKTTLCTKVHRAVKTLHLLGCTPPIQHLCLLIQFEHT